MKADKIFVFIINVFESKVHLLRLQKQYLIGVFLKLGETLLYSFHYSFITAGYMEFFVDVFYMGPYSFITYKSLFCDGFIIKGFYHQAKYFFFPFAQTVIFITR